MAHIQEIYDYAFVPTTNVSFTTAQVPFGIAKACLVMLAGQTIGFVAVGAGTVVYQVTSPAIGAIIPFDCIRMTFTTPGGVIALG